MNISRARSLLVLAIASVYLCPAVTTFATDASESVTSESKNHHLWQPRTRSVAVFKNGLGFFLRQGQVALREGITWIPEYSLSIVDEETAELTLRGTLVNEAEDLIHCDVSTVVGVPHFVHTQYLAPIAVGQVIRTIGAAVGNLPQPDAVGATDYMVYTKNDLTLRRGERAIVTLFVKKIRYGLIYRWTPPSAMEHNLVLRNDTDTAWTTGPVLAVSGETPLSEDLLTYTPKGGRCELPVTAAIDGAHDKAETEADRKFKSHAPRHDYFLDLATLKGTLTLRHFAKTLVEVVVVNAVPGKPHGE